MSDFQSVFAEDEGEWAPLNPKPADTRVVPRLPSGSVSDDEIAFGISPRKFQGIGIKVALAATQAVTEGATGELIEFTTTETSQSFPPLANNVVTVPYSGLYLVMAGVSWEGAASTVVDERGIIEINAATEQSFVSPNSVNFRQRYVLPAAFVLSAGDTVGVRVKHASASARNLGSDTPSDNNLTVVFLFPV